MFVQDWDRGCTSLKDREKMHYCSYTEGALLILGTEGTLAFESDKGWSVLWTEPISALEFFLTL